MKFRKDVGITYLDNLQSAWHADDLIDIRGIYKLLEHFRNKHVAFNQVLPVFFILDYTEQRYLLMTDRLQEISGYHPREFLETRMDKLLDVFHKDDFRVFNSELFARNAAFLGRTPFTDHSKYVFSYNFRFRGDDSKFVNVLQRCTYITSPDNGRPLYSVGALTDITDFKTDAVIVHTIEDATLPYAQRMVERNFFYPDEYEALLTAREKDVLLYIADGFGSKQIAATLGISENTVDNHRQNMLRKTNAKNITQLVAFAIRNKII